MTLLNTLMETCTKLSHKVAALEQDKVAQALDILKLKRRVKRLEKKRRSKHSGLKRLRKERIETKYDDNVAAKEVNAAESTMFNDEEMQEKHLDNIRSYQILKRKPIYVAQARKNMIVYLMNMAGYKMEHFKGMSYDKVRPIFEREYNKVQTLFKPDKDVAEPTKKRVTKETLLHESFKKLRADVEVLSSESTQDTPTDDPKEMSEEDVKNMLEIVLVTEFKVEALQVKEDLDALWRLVKDKFSSAVPTVDKEKALWVELKRHDMYMLTEKDYPLSSRVMTLMLSTRLQVEEDSEMARDLVMKIFMKANQPKSRSLDTSSK
nr:hypothetical protein [Tanacetum cinerariifolium]